MQFRSGDNNSIAFAKTEPTQLKVQYDTTPASKIYKLIKLADPIKENQGYVDANAGRRLLNRETRTQVGRGCISAKNNTLVGVWMANLLIDSAARQFVTSNQLPTLLSPKAVWKVIPSIFHQEVTHDGFTGQKDCRCDIWA